MILSFNLAALYEEGKLSLQEVEEIVLQLVNAPLLYDEGSSISVEDYIAGIEFTPQQEILDALKEFYELSVKACHHFSDAVSYELLQDCTGVQAELWQEGVLTLREWTQWLYQAGNGAIELPHYEFDKMFTALPEGFMIHDFYDELRYQLEENPDTQWALDERGKLYDHLGVRTEK